MRSRGLLATGVARDCGDVGSVAGWPSGREWNGLQPGQGAPELGFPRPAPGEMQSEAARRAGDPSHQSEDPPPEGLGDHGPLAQSNPRRPAARLCAITWTASQAPLAAKRPDGMWFSPTPYLRSVWSSRPRRGGDAASSSSVSPSRSVTGVIAVSGEEGELGTGCRLHPPDNETRRRGVRLGLERGVSRLGDIGGAVHPVGMGVQSSSGIASIRSRRLARWRMVIEKRTSISRQAATTVWA